MSVVIGNIISLLASVLMTYSGYIKSKGKFLIVQIVQMSLSALSNFILGGITGTIINLVNIIRNVLCYKNKLNKYSIILILTLSISLSLYFNNLNFIGLLPLLSTILYTTLMNIKNIKKFKYLTITTMLLWLIYDICIMNYVSALFDLLTIGSNSIAIYQLKNIAKK
ncbi:MAG: YgjV family protein [Bacilli bacterium]|nr:YgjV family protein [Bacilli bacterium]